MMEKVTAMTLKHSLIFLTSLAATAAAMTATAATMSGEEFKEYAPEEAYWVVSVDCGDGSSSRVIQRKTDGNQWCGKDISGYCFDTKPEAAKAVCGAEYSTALTEIQQQAQEQAKLEQERKNLERQRREEATRQAAAQQRAEEAKRQNQINIDEQLLQIEQEKLSLRRQKLELQRRAVEVREALEGLDQ